MNKLFDLLKEWTIKLDFLNREFQVTVRCFNKQEGQARSNLLTFLHELSEVLGYALVIYCAKVVTRLKVSKDRWVGCMKQVKARIGVYRKEMMATAVTLTFDPGLTSDQLLRLKQLVKNLPHLDLTILDNKNMLVLAGASTEEKAKFRLVDLFDSIYAVLQYKLTIIPT